MPFDMTHEFDTYEVYYYTPGKSASAYGPKCVLVNLSKGSAQVGQLVFYPDTYANPPKDTIWNTEKITVHYWERQFGQIMTILREEKPLYIHIRTSSNITTSSRMLEGVGMIMTSKEPVGEQEGV